VSTFKGKVQVQSTPTGYAVRFEATTDAHDLGHAIAAIVTSYLHRYKKQDPAADVEALRGIVLEGVTCGLEHNPEPLKPH
jgi:hypothetical protein